MALVALGLGLAISLALATGIGRMDIGWKTVDAVILGKLGFSAPVPDHTTEVVIWDIRLSRVALAGLVGASLAAAGVVFQGLLLNPLADPFTLGVSTGAAFGVALLVMLGVGGSYLGLSPLPLGALVGALAAMVAVMVLSRESGRIRKESLILAGIVVSTFLAALISLIKSLDEESLSAIVFWIMGSFSGRGWIHVGFLVPYAAAGLALAACHHRELDLLALGEEQSAAPGGGRLQGAAPACCWAPPSSPPGPWRSPGSSASWAWWCRTWCGSWPAPPTAASWLLSAADRSPAPDLGRRAGPNPAGQRPGTAGGRGHRPVGRTVFLLSAKIPAGQGDVVIRAEELWRGL